jgi:ubiquinone/menaquinone biosynthesis C-methylase UbiE
MSEDHEVRFATDLYRGTAEYYDRYRLPYRRAMLADLATRAQVSEHGRLLDLACGTGQLAFALRRQFAEVWAVDQEPDMVDLVRTKAAAMSAGHIRAIASSAESLEVEPGYFELAVIGNAFHRLDRDTVASRIFRWLQPGGHLALCWSSSPWTTAGTDWQRALVDVLDMWRARLGAEERVPEGWDAARRHRPDVQVLADAGFEVVGRQEFSREQRWSLLELGGLVRSTSFLPASVLGEQSAAFDAELADALRPYADGGVYAETVSFAYELARKPDAAD